MKLPPMREVKSSAISHVGYDPAEQLMAVTFQSGKTYLLPDTSRDEYDALMAAESIGQTYGAMFAGRKVVKYAPPEQDQEGA